MAESFVIYKSFHEALKELSREQYGNVMFAINEYALYDIEPEGLTGIENAIFIMAKPQIDANRQRQEAGKFGGRPKAEKPPVSEKTKTEKPPVLNNTENEKPPVSEKAETQKPNVNDNVNLNVNENVVVVAEPREEEPAAPDTTTTISLENIINKCTSLGYSYDDYALSRIKQALSDNNLPPEYLDYMIETLNPKPFKGRKFETLPLPEKHTILLTAVTKWEDYRNGYKVWQRKKALQKFTEKKRIPPKCKCGGTMTLVDSEGIAKCPDCGALYENRNGQWLEIESANISLMDLLKDSIQVKQKNLNPMEIF